MELLNLTLDTAAENVALDEALLDAAEAGTHAREVLRLWELTQSAVVLGRSSRAAEEVDLERCQQQGLAVVRRSSGGAAIVAGPGCLMYSLVLDCRRRPELRHVDRAHTFVLSHLAAALGQQLPLVAPRGTSDLALGSRKFSGNSLRIKRDWLLYHGTLLYAMDLARLDGLLLVAPRQPEYRQGRRHSEFVTNLPLERTLLEQTVTAAFAAATPCDDWPRGEVQRLVLARYGREEWTFQR